MVYFQSFEFDSLIVMRQLSKAATGNASKLLNPADILTDTIYTVFTVKRKNKLEYSKPDNKCQLPQDLVSRSRATLLLMAESCVVQYCAAFKTYFQMLTERSQKNYLIQHRFPQLTCLQTRVFIGQYGLIKGIFSSVV